MGVRVRVQLLLVVLLTSVLSLPCLARTHLAGYVEQGGQRHLNSGIYSITRSGATQTNPYSMQSYPSATVTVYVTGTLTIATIYSDTSGTAKANPFTASSNAYWSFYVDDGIYDIRFSGGGITTPYTWSGITAAGDSFAVSVTGFGAVCNGTTDDTVAIQAAIDVIGGHIVQLPAGTCRITDQLLVNQNYITVQGTGMRASFIKYDPSVNGEAAIKAQFSTATTILYTTIKDFGIYTTNTTNSKIGIWIVDGTATRIDSVQIGTDGNWTGGASVSPFTGAGSIGIKLQGRDYYSITRTIISADIPLYVGLNPNASTLDLDHSNFKLMDYHPFGDNPAIYVESGANLTNVTWEQAALVFGTYGFYWNDTSGTASSYDVVFRQVRLEQMTDSPAAGYLFYVSNPSGIYDLRFENIYGGGGNNPATLKGVYLRGISSVATFDAFRYAGTDECLNADSTVQEIDWRNSICETGSTIDTGTLVNLWNQGTSSQPMWRSSRWVTPNSIISAGAGYRLHGVNVDHGTGTLADDATFTVPSGSGSIVTGLIDISFKSTNFNGAISCAINSARTITLATTDATIAGCTGNVDGDFTLEWASASAILIRNRLGESVTYNYRLFWN